MAKNNNNGLYLPLKINLDEWQKQLATADADLQKAMRQMRAEVKDLKLRYDVEMSGAEAAGDRLKVMQLQTAKLNQLYDIQKKKVEALNQAYQKSVKETGEMSQASKNLANTLAKESIALNKLQMQLNATGEGLGAKLSNKLAEISPEFARARQSIGEVVTTMGELSTAGGLSATALTAVGVAVGTVVAALGAVKGMNMLDEHVQSTAKSAAAAAESIFALRENFNLTTADAEKFAGVMAIDGTNADALATAMRKLNKQLESAGEDGNLASNTLAKYGVSLKNADGSMKSMSDQVKALADGYQRAKEAGDDLNFVTSTLGAGGSQFTHLLNGYDDYVKAWENIGRLQKTEYDQLHLLYQKQNELAEAERQLAVAKGQSYSSAGIEKINAEIRARKEELQWLEQNEAIYKDIGEGMKEWNRLIEVVGKKWTAVVNSVVAGWQMIFAKAGGGVAGKIADLLGLPQAAKEAKNLEVELNKINNKKPVTATTTTTKTDKKAEKEALKQQEDALKKLQEARKRYDEAVFQSQATDYEKQIHRIEQERDAYIQAGISEVEAYKLFSSQKEAIDNQFYAKQQAERDKALKASQEAYKKQAEEAKKAYDSAVSQAQQTVQNNVKLIRYIQKQQAEGNKNWRADAEKYAEKLYMKQAGIRETDISGAKSIGLDVISQIANVRDRLFGQFAQKPAEQVTNNNAVTINFDGTVVESQDMVDRLANKVAEAIIQVVEPAVQRGATNYGY